EALHLVATLRAQPIELVDGLYPFRGRCDVEAAAEPRNCAHDRHTVGTSRKILHEGTVDLYLVEGKAAQVAEARISGAKIVHRDADTEPAQLMQDREIRLCLRQEYRFGDFKLEAPWRQARLRQRGDHDLDQVAAAELHRRQIDRNLYLRRPFHRFRT